MEIDRIPNEFWEDKDWAFDHYSEWMQKYPDQWIAVVDKKIVASGKDVQEIKRTAREKTGRKHIAVIYIEGDVRMSETKLSRKQSIRGKYAFVRTSSEDFAKRKQQEIDML